MTDAELTERLPNYRWYHTIQLSPNVVTPGVKDFAKHAAPFLRLMEKVDFAGKRVVDIGARDGLFCFEAERRGAADVLGVEDHNRVWVTEFCMHDSLMRSDGNAAYLRPALADNDVIVDVLRSKGYFTEDVYAVKMMGDDTISLYVHRFDD